MRKLFLLILVIFTGIAEAATVKSVHPRIWLTPESKTQLISRLSPGGQFSPYYIRIKAYVDSNPGHSGNAYAEHRYWISVLLCALVEGGSYIDIAKNQISAWKIDPQFCYSEFNSVSISLMYDWLFDQLTALERRDICDTLLSWWNYQSSSSAYVQSSWNNHFLEWMSGFVFGSLAVYGDGYRDAEAAENLERARKWLYDEAIACTNLAAGALASGGIHGGWTEGAYYWERGGYALLENIYAWTTATDENALDACGSMATLSRWLFFNTRQDGTIARFGDGNAIPAHLTNDPNGSVLFYMLAKIYNDSYAKYLWNKRVGATSFGASDGMLNASGSMLSDSYSNIYSYYVLFNNSVQPITTDVQPLSAYFDGMDMVTLRSGFAENDVYFMYKNNDRMSGHDHFDAGHFEISRGASSLAIDAGAYEGGDISPNRHDTKYYQRTVAHNSVTVYDPDEIWDDYYGYFTTNDGGQKWQGASGGANRPTRYADFFASSSWDRGGILRYETAQGYSYFLADVTPAYARADGADQAVTNSSKMKLFHRQVMFINEKYFVIFDNIVSSNANFTKRWLLHSINEPSVSENSAVITNGASVMHVTTLLPKPSTIIKRGGPGYEYWTNYSESGENPIFNTQYYGRPPNEPGSWRLELSPQDSSLHDVFLNILYPAETGSEMPPAENIDAGVMNGVQISGSESTVVLFGSNAAGADVEGMINYTITPSIAGTAHYLCNIPCDLAYNVTVSNGGADISVFPDAQGSIVSSSKGVLSFVTTLTGYYADKDYAPQNPGNLQIK